MTDSSPVGIFAANWDTTGSPHRILVGNSGKGEVGRGDGVVGGDSGKPR